MKRRITVVGAPVWRGQPHYGTQFGPDAIRAAGLIKMLRSLGGDVIDEGNIKFPAISNPSDDLAGARHLAEVVTQVESLAGKVDEIVAGGRFPLVLGGDHSVALGSLAGIAKHYQSLGVIWYDAHTDINTVETSPSGNIHGMPLAASMGLGAGALVAVGGYRQKVCPENIVFIGARDVDPGEWELIRRAGIKTFSMEDLQERGAKQIAGEALAYLAVRCDGIHLSFDLDVLDPAAACGVGTPVAGGADLADTLAAVDVLYQSGLITSAEFVELNPLLDRRGQTGRVAVSLIRTLWGGKEARLNEVAV